MKKLQLLLFSLTMSMLLSATTKMSTTSFESDLTHSDPAFTIVPMDPTSNPSSWTLATTHTTEGLKATYNYNAGNLTGTFGLFDIVFSTPIDLQEDASLILTSISVHNAKSSSTTHSVSSGLNEFKIEAYDDQGELLNISLATTKYAPRTLYVNQKWNSYTNLYQTSDTDKLSKVKRLSFKIIFGGNGWGAGYITIPYIKIGKASDETPITYLNYDFTQESERNNLLLALKNDQYSSSQIDPTQTTGDALYVKNSNRENAEFFSILLPTPLKMDYNLSYTLLSKVIGMAQKDYSIRLFDGKNRNYTLKYVGQWDINNIRVVETETADWFDRIIPVADKNKIDFANIRKIEMYSIGKTTETWAIKSLLIGNTGHDATISSTCFKYDFNGNKLFSPHYCFDTKDGGRYISRKTENYLDIELVSSGQWNAIYLKTSLTNTIDLSLSKKVKLVIDSYLDYTDADETVEFLLLDEAGKTASVSMTKPNGELIIDFAGKEVVDFDWTKVKELTMRSTAWGNNAKGIFKVSYLEIGLTSAVHLAADVHSQQWSGYNIGNEIRLTNLTAGMQVQISDITGKHIASDIVSGHAYTITLNRGVYIVSVDGKSIKMVVSK